MDSQHDDWSDSFDDKDSSDWDDAMDGGPDDRDIEMFEEENEDSEDEDDWDDVEWIDRNWSHPCDKQDNLYWKNVLSDQEERYIEKYEVKISLNGSRNDFWNKSRDKRYRLLWEYNDTYYLDEFVINENEAD